MTTKLEFLNACIREICDDKTCDEHGIDKANEDAPKVMAALPKGAVTITLNELLGLVAKVMADGKFTRDDAPVLIEAVEQLYDDFVAPYDIKWLPNWIEPQFDEFVKQMIPGRIRAMFDLLPA